MIVHVFPWLVLKVTRVGLGENMTSVMNLGRLGKMAIKFRGSEGLAMQ